MLVTAHSTRNDRLSVQGRSDARVRSCSVARISIHGAVSLRTARIAPMSRRQANCIVCIAGTLTVLPMHPPMHQQVAAVRDFSLLNVRFRSWPCVNVCGVREGEPLLFFRGAYR